MSNYEADECKHWVDASTQALRTYYQQAGASQFNLNEALDTLVTLTDRSQRTVHSEQQKKFTELSNRPTLALYMGFSDQLIPSDVKNQRLQPFMPSPREQSQSRPTPGGQKNQKAEPLKFFNLLCDLEQNLCLVFNKLNNIEYASGVVNLSNYPLTNIERNVLSKGLGFCPTPGTPDIGNLIQDLDEFKRKTRLQLFFSGNNENPSEDSNQSDAPFEHKSFKNKSTFNPIGPFQLESMFYSIEQDLHRQRYTQPRHRNLSSEEYKAIKLLQHNPNIVIKPADKGSAIVILDRQYYISEGLRQLIDHNFYEQTNTDHTGEVINRVNLHVHNMLQRGQITQRTCNYLTTNVDRTQQFYLLPKIHKDPLNPPGRPIVSGSGGPTERISQLVDHFIGNIVPLSQSYIRDSTHLINILKGISLQPGMLLCTLDITSLYTNIPHNEGIEAIKKMLAIHRPPDSKPHNNYIIELLELVLTNNHFEFNGNYYHQLSGTAMGTKLAPSYAYLFMATFEDKYVYTYPQKPTLWKRFIDDIFLIWPHGRESLLRFIEHLNRVHPPLNSQVIYQTRK